MGLLKKVQNQLTRIRYNKSLSIISHYKKIEGWLTDNEALGLYLLAGKVEKNGVVVEIGSWKGKSTFCLAKGLKSGKVFAIDPFNAEGEEDSKRTYDQLRGEIPLFDQFMNTLKTYSLDSKIQPLKGYSNQFIKSFSRIDLLFIDGDHSIKGCDFDFVSYSPLVKKGGFIAFHDFDESRDSLGPTWVIKNRIMNNPGYKFYRKHDSLWIAQKLGLYPF